MAQKPELPWCINDESVTCTCDLKTTLQIIGRRLDMTGIAGLFALTGKALSEKTRASEEDIKKMSLENRLRYAAGWAEVKTILIETGAIKECQNPPKPGVPAVRQG